ncbi:unnamed protein product [Euphydryas editha]|uniref:DNA helicase n=1 Tax=Euphydryas editha TaxID=104508 RepID=A0AAU9UJ95_EUPED|nr:unnamed protein product [Euphydryas editha]
MVDDKILDIVKSISGDRDVNTELVGWQLPKMTWINRLLGCAKTSHIVGNFDENVEIVATTVDAAKIKEKLTRCYGEKARSRSETNGIILIGDVNQLPYVDKENQYQMILYTLPDNIYIRCY